MLLSSLGIILRLIVLVAARTSPYIAAFDCIEQAENFLSHQLDWIYWLLEVIFAIIELLSTVHLSQINPFV